MRTTIYTTALVLIVAVNLSYGQSIVHRWKVVDNGGGKATAGGITLQASIAQPAVATMSTGGIRLEEGYIPGLRTLSGASTITVGVPVALNWNIVSLPVSNPTSGDSVRQVYVNSSFPYGFAFVPGSGYQQRYIMQNGPGYWVKSTATYTQDITGIPRDTLTIPVNTGWNMIGSISTSIDTSAAYVTPTPADLRASNFFKYNNGYVVAATIDPGFGYWVKANGAGTFRMHASGPAARPSGKQSRQNSKATVEHLNTLTIQDANGGSQTLYFGADETGEIPVSMYVMPPLPPAGSFDARFVSAEGGTLVKTHPVEVSEVIEAPIAIQSSAYPLTVSWKVTDGLYELRYGEGAVQTLQGEGTLKITTNEVSQLTLRVTGSGSELPTEYALYQNYPNPFNPSTTIRFEVPRRSSVELSVFNVLGQKVATLLDEVRDAGRYSLVWHGTNDEGLKVGSGVYFYRIRAEDGRSGTRFVETKKLLLLK